MGLFGPDVLYFIFNYVILYLSFTFLIIIYRDFEILLFGMAKVWRRLPSAYKECQSVFGTDYNEDNKFSSTLF